MFGLGGVPFGEVCVGAIFSGSCNASLLFTSSGLAFGGGATAGFGARPGM